MFMTETKLNIKQNFQQNVVFIPTASAVAVRTLSAVKITISLENFIISLR